MKKTKGHNLKKKTRKRLHFLLMNYFAKIFKKKQNRRKQEEEVTNL